MYQKEKPHSVSIETWKFYQKGALLGDFTAVTDYSHIHAASVVDSVPLPAAREISCGLVAVERGSPESRGSNLLCGLQSSEPPPPPRLLFSFW